MGKIHSIETFGAVDGPGIRFVIFLQGCPMRCKYCHNPDTWELSSGKDMTINDLMVEIRKYKHYFGDDGGVTVSGGEPMVQIDFVTELFETLKSENIHTCLDTCGVLYNKSEEMNQKIEKLLSFTDLILLDLKHINSDSHKDLTGHKNENILEFAKYLSDINKPVWIRHVLVPTINADEENLTKLRTFLDALTNVQKIEVLPYHTLGEKKYEKLNIAYPLVGVPVPTKQQIEIANKILKKGENK